VSNSIPKQDCLYVYVNGVSTDPIRSPNTKAMENVQLEKATTEAAIFFPSP